jgi:DNA-binding response OmpR family regulator
MQTPARLLIVEDDTEIAFMLATALPALGYEVQLAESLAQARHCLRDDTVDLVLVDWLLPDGSGEDVCAAARAMRGTVPIVVMTGLQDDRIEAIMECKPDAFFTKPFPLDDLSQALQRLVERDAPDGGDEL